MEAGERLRRSPVGYWNLSTLKEPYRAEGKKTMGLELAEQLDWKLPDWIIYPTGGGTGIVGMHKAFAELERLGLIAGATTAVRRRAGRGLRAHRACLEGGGVDGRALGGPAARMCGADGFPVPSVTS